MWSLSEKEDILNNFINTVTEVDEKTEQQKQQYFFQLLFVITLDTNIVVIDHILKSYGES